MRVFGDEIYLPRILGERKRFPEYLLLSTHKL